MGRKRKGNHPDRTDTRYCQQHSPSVQPLNTSLLLVGHKIRLFQLSNANKGALLGALLLTVGMNVPIQLYLSVHGSFILLN